MAWEQRKGGLFYYRKVREGKSVRSVYMGRSAIVGMIADLDEERRFVQAMAREREDALDALVGASEAQFKATMETVREALEGAGYHKRKGQWRKRKDD